jgi:crotonobetainyl-CoA:carnitine CoA-transferase CaiB-like acyl-CoA transferase
VHIDMALLDVQLGVLANQAMNYLVSGRVPTRMGNAHPNLAPYALFAAQDGTVIIAVGNDGQFRALCAALELPHLADDDRFRSNAARIAHRADLTALLQARLHSLGRETILDLLEEAGVPAGPVNTVAQAFDDPHVKHRGMAIASAVRNDPATTVPGVRAPILFNGEPPIAPFASPAFATATPVVEAAWENHPKSPVA